MQPITMHRVALGAVLALLVARPAGAQQPAVPAGGATVEVTVHDSLAGRLLPGALVQIVSQPDPMALSRSGESDSLGRVVFRGVPRGRYSLGFMHQVLDELGIVAPQRELEVDGTGTQRIDLAVPPASRLRRVVCGNKAGSDSAAWFVGAVRDPRDRSPVNGAKVTAEWAELTFAKGGIQQHVQRITATTGDNGWFALCGLPPGTVAVTAKQGTDSTHRLELQLKANELYRRELFVAAAGEARLQGRVVTADSGRPLPGAKVSVIGGPEGAADARGNFVLGAVPLGTRMLEVRAVGYYPERRVVDVVADAPPVEVAIATFGAVLAAVRVTADRSSLIADQGGFADRQRRGGMGRFYTPERIANLNPVFTSDLLRQIPGFLGDGTLAMKGNFSDGGGNMEVNCSAEVYIDGHLMRGISAEELDAVVDPDDIQGMEVYSTGSPRPPQFNSGMSGCGALVIWQKPLSQRGKKKG